MGKKRLAHNLEKIEIALQLVRDKVLEVRPDGTVWRWFDGRGQGGGKWLTEPRRADRLIVGGYRAIYWAKEPGTQRTWNLGVHRLVWAALRGPIPQGMEINHIDGNPGNNAVDNLELVTPAENIEHSHRVGRTAIAMRLANAKRSAVRHLHGLGYSLSEIEKALGIPRAYADLMLHSAHHAVTAEWMNSRVLAMTCSACSAAIKVSRGRRRREEVVLDAQRQLVESGCKHINATAMPN